MDVAVLGADATGRGIARVCAAAGHEVALHDDDVNAVMDAIDAVQAGLADADGLAGDTRGDAVDRIEGTTGLDAAVGDADVVVDATGGDRDARRTLLAEVEEHVDGDTLLAVSGTTVSITAVATGLRQPGRAVGIHFVDAATGPSDSATGQLVEVVVADQTTQDTRDRAVSFVEGLDRETVVVRDVPGFATSRLALALSVEAMQMVDEHVAGVAAIDRALTLGADHPVGPLEAADRAGLDARLDELEHLADSLGDRFTPPPVLREKVERGDLGRKNGEGFYVWESGDPVEPNDPDPTANLRATDPANPGDPADPGGPGGSDGPSGPDGDRGPDGDSGPDGFDGPDGTGSA